jgi:hypothetical protein
MKRSIAALLALGLIGGTASAATPSRWSRYFDRRTGNVVFVRTRCIRGEDSAARLRLVQYADSGARIVLGCHRRGY